VLVVRCAVVVADCFGRAQVVRVEVEGLVGVVFAGDFCDLAVTGVEAEAFFLGRAEGGAAPARAGVIRPVVLGRFAASARPWPSRPDAAPKRAARGRGQKGGVVPWTDASSRSYPWELLGKGHRRTQRAMRC